MTDRGQRPLNSEDRYWARRALTLSENSLKDVRATAEKWRAGLMGLTGILTTALAVAAPFVGGSVKAGPPRYVLLLFMALAVVALGFGTWNAMSAAFGVPTEIHGDGESLRTWSERAAKTAAEQLACARLMTVAGFACLLIAAAVGLVCTQPTGEGNRVVLNNGNEYCGSLEFRDDGKEVAVTGSDGTTHTAALSSIASIEHTADCD